MLIFKSEVISSQERLFCYFLGLSVFCLLCGCGTTKWSDTGRTATEQLLISSAMEELIDEYDYYALSNRSVFVKMNSCTDSEFLRPTEFLLKIKKKRRNIFWKWRREPPGRIGMI